MKNLKVRVYGRVQGVGFRYNARDVADELGICGLARNEPDGSVYIEAQGSDAALKKFLEWCKKGSWPAKVEKVDFEFSDAAKNYRQFDILILAHSPRL